jgi:hypothetical protein
MKYCPKCKSEYEDWVEACADCNVQLADKLPEEPPLKLIKYRELLSTFNPSDVAFIKSLLEGSGIRYYVQGENFLYMRPLAQPAGIMIDEEQYEDAKELLKDFKGRFTGLAPRNSDDS